MISKLADAEYQKMVSEGLHPTLKDAVELNALGLKVEHGPNSANFADLPRTSFLGDLILVEPSVGKRIWLDAVMAAFPDLDFPSRLNLVAYALNTPDEDLPEAGKPKDVARKVRKFRDRHLFSFSLSEIGGAVDWALNGADPFEAEDPPIETNKSSEAPDPRGMPYALKSAAHAVLLNALAMGIEKTAAEAVTMPILERMIAINAMIRGSDRRKGDHADATARFYRGLFLIRERLKGETNAHNNEGIDNGI